jgi:hypothetical protein
MDYKTYGENRWTVVCGSCEGLEELAVNRIYGTINQYVPYVITLTGAQACAEELADVNPVLIGTVESNPHIARLVREGVVRLSGKREGYGIQVAQSVFNPQKQMVVIAGDDENGVYYGAVDFANLYLPTLYNNQTLSNHEDLPPFAQAAMPVFERTGAPYVQNRGLWTWGHSVYDYRGMFDNMAELKLNQIVIWNDYVPVNAERVVRYAHSRGIRVFWGFAWAWDVDVNAYDLSDQACMQALADRAVEDFERDYAALEGDGIYIQSFTETGHKVNNGVVIAEAVTNFVNGIAGRILERHPGLQIQFGLHATSVDDQLAYLKRVDPRIYMIWEDCGAFPYSYDAGNLDDFEGTKAFSRQIAALRGEEGRFGVVLKGMTTLPWPEFEHQKGPFLMGEADRTHIRRRTAEARKLWRYIQAYWLKNAGAAYDVIQTIAQAKKGDLTVQLLADDGMFEEKAWYPVALAAQMLWDCGAPLEDILCNAALNDRAEFA